MKTSGLDIVSAIDLSNKFLCDLYNRKSNKLYKFDDVYNSVYSFEEILFHNWEIVINYYSFAEAIDYLFNHKDKLVFWVRDHDFIELRSQGNVITTKGGDYILLTKKITESKFIVR